MKTAYSDRIAQLFDFPDPHVIRVHPSSRDTDGYGHVNNSVFLLWLDRCVWSHCEDISMDAKRCHELNRGMVVARHEINYLRSAYPGDSVLVANWVTANDGRLRAERRFQVIRERDHTTLLRATTYYVCVDMNREVPARMPEEFIHAFCVHDSVAAKLGTDRDDR